MEKKGNSKFDKIFPLIQDAIRKLSFSGEWVDRDSIVNEIKGNPILIDCHFEYLQEDNPQINAVKWPINQWVTNEIAHFSRDYTLIRNSLVKELERVPEIKNNSPN